MITTSNKNKVPKRGIEKIDKKQVQLRVQKRWQKDSYKNGTGIRHNIQQQQKQSERIVCNLLYTLNLIYKK